MPRHGKPTSECHGAKLLKRVVGEWTEWTCAECKANADEDGRLYRYATKDLHASGPP